MRTAKILAVDDEPENLEIFRFHFRDEFELSLALFVKNARSRGREAETTRMVMGTGNATEPSGANVGTSLSDFLWRWIFTKPLIDRLGTVDE